MLIYPIPPAFDAGLGSAIAVDLIGIVAYRLTRLTCRGLMSLSRVVSQTKSR